LTCQSQRKWNAVEKQWSSITGEHASYPPHPP